jgi:hypothetical protein
MYNGKLENVIFTSFYVPILHPINKLKKDKQAYKQCSVAIIMLHGTLYL